MRERRETMKKINERDNGERSRSDLEVKGEGVGSTGEDSFEEPEDCLEEVASFFFDEEGKKYLNPLLTRLIPTLACPSN